MFLDVQVQDADSRPDTVIISSQAMRCEFPVKRAELGQHIEKLFAEWKDLVEAGEL